MHDAVAGALWEQVLADWENDTVHEAFLQACEEQTNLAYAAGRYREVKEEADGDRHERCDAQLERITGLAMAQMATLKSEPKSHRKAILILAAIVSISLTAACIYMIQLF
jgi:hypothetical protein